MDAQGIGATERTQEEILVAQMTLDYLRRISRTLENQAAGDAGQRARIVIDAITAGLTLAAVTTVATVSNVAVMSTVDSYRGYELFAFNARIAYNTGIRSKIG